MSDTREFRVYDTRGGDRHASAFLHPNGNVGVIASNLQHVRLELDPAAARELGEWLLEHAPRGNQ